MVVVRVKLLYAHAGRTIWPSDNPGSVINQFLASAARAIETQFTSPINQLQHPWKIALGSLEMIRSIHRAEL